MFQTLKPPPIAKQANDETTVCSGIGRCDPRRNAGHGPGHDGCGAFPERRRRRATSVDQKDRQFITEAASGGMAEVKLGQLAQQKASATGVRDFGRRLVDDHQAADAKLKQVADKLGGTLPTAPDTKDQRTYDRLEKLNGAEFDRAYMRDMVADHRKDVADFQKEENASQNPDLRDFVQKTTPTLQQHLAMAQQPQDSLTGSGSSSKVKTGRKSDATKHADRRGTGKSSDYAASSN